MAIYLLLALSTGTPALPPKRPPAPRTLTACAAVTRADVEQATGRTMSEGAEEIDGPTSTCDYSSRHGMVSITIHRLAAKPDLQAEIAAMKKAIPEAAVRDAPGFGDAFYVDVAGAGTQLHIINGSSAHVMISVLGFGDAPYVSAAAARMARKALQRL